MEPVLRATLASPIVTSSLSVRRAISSNLGLCSTAAPRRIRHRPRCLHTSTTRPATPLPHPTVVGPPPPPPQVSVSSSEAALNRKREIADRLKAGENLKVDPAKPTTALKKRFWKDVSIVETPTGLQVHLDKRPVRTATKATLTIPHSKRALASGIALEWDQLVSAQQALKHHYIPLTALVSRAIDISAAEAARDTAIRETIVEMAMRYLSTDTLLCWAPERNIHEPELTGKPSLRSRQREMAEPIIGFLRTHVFPGVDINPILGEDSIRPEPQPQLTQQVIQGWVSGLPAWELAALERGILASKSLLIASRLLVDWSPEFAHLRKEGEGVQRFGTEEAAAAASLETLFQTEQWGEVEDTHDVEHADMRRQLGSVVLLVS
nr:hypothetical protein B0A51_14721 [Rachicladosporium sp. CCFEE 5018]